MGVSHVVQHTELGPPTDTLMTLGNGETPLFSFLSLSTQSYLSPIRG